MVTPPKDYNPRKKWDWEVSPKVFYIHLHPWLDFNEPWEKFDALRREAEGVQRRILARRRAAVYLELRLIDFFGFPDHDDDSAVREALVVLRTCQRDLPPEVDVTLHVSMGGKNKYRPVLKDPAAYIGRKKLKDALTCGVGFLNYDYWSRH